MYKRQVYLHISPLFHLGGFSPSHSISIVGGTHVFSSDASSIGRYNVDFIVGVPEALISIASHEESYSSSVKTVLYGGNGMDKNIRDNLIHKQWPNAKIFGAYGMTEASSSITFLNHSVYDNINKVHDERKNNFVGFVPSHIQLKIDNKLNKANQSKRDEIGEIFIKGPNVFHGYYHKSIALNTIFRNKNENQWFSTGDIGYIDKETGGLFVYGRKYDVIKSGGESVFAPEVEAHLLNDPYVNLSLIHI